MGLFLMGMKMMGDSLTKSTGSQVRQLLIKLTQNRFLAFLTGIFTTMVFQSSTATSVMLVSFVNSRLMKFTNTVAMIFGAAIGATLTIQLIAFRLTDYSLTLVAAGFILYLISRQPKFRSISLSVIGFGILFLGMGLMSESIEPFKNMEGFTGFLSKLEHPLAGLLAGACMTALMQSSSAFIGILIVLSGKGILTLEAAVPMIIGANIGTAITVVIAAIGGSKESKQVALAHTLFKVIGALIIVWFIPAFVHFIVKISPHSGLLPGVPVAADLPRQIANAHTVFNTLIAFVFLPFTAMFARFVQRLLPAGAEKHPSLATWYIDDNLLRTPDLALRMARQEVLRMMEIAQRMAEDIISPFMDKKSEALVKIRIREEEINYLRDAINGYLLKIVRHDLTSSQVQEAYQMMFAIDEFEQIGDVIAGSMAEKAEKWCNRDYHFSREGKVEILDFHLKTLKILYRVYATFEASDQKGIRKEARKSKMKYSQFRKIYFDLERQHYERLRLEVEESVDSSRTHLEIIGALKNIGSHATNIARIMLKEKPNGSESSNRSQLEGSSQG
jgi:phosphate:Na+ symporter